MSKLNKANGVLKYKLYDISYVTERVQGKMERARESKTAKKVSEHT
jgi:hypothetical protein